jgi:hypothetical protein
LLHPRIGFHVASVHSIFDLSLNEWQVSLFEARNFQLFAEYAHFKTVSRFFCLGDSRRRLFAQLLRRARSGACHGAVRGGARV